MIKAIKHKQNQIQSQSNLLKKYFAQTLNNEKPPCWKDNVSYN